MTELERKVGEKVKALIDPETGASFGAMGLIQSVMEIDDGLVRIDFTPTSPFCPIAFKFASDIKTAARSVDGVKKALVYVHGHTMEEQINQTVNRE